MRSRVVGDFFGCVSFQIENVKLLGPATGIALPGAEITEERRVDDFGPIGREIAGAGEGHGQSLREAAVRRNGVETIVAEIEVLAQGAEYDGFSIRGPAIDLIVVTPAWCERAAGGIERQLLGDAAGHWDDIDLLVAVILPGECDPFAIGRELGEDLDAGMRGQTSGQAARSGGEPEIAGVSEDNFVAVNIGKAKQLCLGVGICGKCGSEAQAQQGKKFARRHEDPFRYTAYQASAE